MRVRHGLIAIAAAASMAACSPAAMIAVDAGGGEAAVYDVPIKEVRRILAEAEQPPMVFGDSAVDFVLEDVTDTRLVWSVSQDGGEVLRYTADLTEAADGGTEVSLALTGSKAGKYGNVEDRLAKHEEARTMYLAAMQERIAADLQAREYDMWKVYPAMTKAALAKPELFELPKDPSRENMQKAYRDELEAGRNY